MTNLAARTGHGLLGMGIALAGLMLSRGCGGSCSACFGCASTGGLLGGWLLIRLLWQRRRVFKRSGIPKHEAGSVRFSRPRPSGSPDRRNGGTLRHCDADSSNSGGS